MAFILDALNLPELLRSEVSIWKCMAGLAGWLAEGDANSAVALAMYAVFVVLMPCAHMCLLVFAAVSPPERSQRAVRLAAPVGHLCMLDVSVMGTVVIAMALTNLKDQGVVISLSSGLLPLLGAEVCRYGASALMGHHAKTAAAGACGEAAPGKACRGDIDEQSTADSDLEANMAEAETEDGETDRESETESEARRAGSEPSELSSPPSAWPSGSEAVD